MHPSARIHAQLFRISTELMLVRVRRYAKSFIMKSGEQKMFRFNYLALILFLMAVADAQRRGQPPGAIDEFRFRFVGPLVGNRIASVAAVPGDINTYYAGAASGGIFKSVDGGFGWTPIFDGQPVAAIGALAVAPSNPSVVWAGTGEAWAIRDVDVIGNGI